MFDALIIQEKPHIVLWAEENLRVPRETSPALPGKLSFRRQPYMREILESLANDELEHVYMCMATQTGKTMTCLIGASYWIDVDPAPMIWALPTDGLAKSFSRARLQPMISKNPCLARHKRGDVHAFSNMEMLLDNSEIYMTGVSEPAKLSSRPIARCVLDEEAKYEHKDKAEAHPSDLLEERTKTFHRKKMVHASTPNAEDNYFWQNFMTTDYRRYFVPCPTCGEMFAFEWSRSSVQWEKNDKLDGEAWLDYVEAHTFYVCPNCERKIFDHEKIGMMEKGEWRVTNPKASKRRRGYHLNTLYSPFVTWGAMARKFLEAQGELFAQVSIHNFQNSWLALPYSQYAVKVRDEAVRGLVGTYRRRELPDEYYYMSIAYDPGEARTHWVAMCVGAGGEIWVVDWGTVLSMEDILPHYKSFEVAGVKPMLGFIDSGDWTKKVYEVCRRSAGRLYPSKGSGANFGTWGESEPKSHPDLVLYTYIDRTIKMELYAERIQRGEGAKIHLPIDADDELVRGLSGQELKKINGSSIYQWKKLEGDHYGDCLKLGGVLSWWVLAEEYEDVENLED